jgi:hypothetical protein
VGSGFDELVKTMGEDDINIVQYVSLLSFYHTLALTKISFDFHAETKGMK